MRRSLQSHFCPLQRLSTRAAARYACTSASYCSQNAQLNRAHCSAGAPLRMTLAGCAGTCAQERAQLSRCSDQCGIAREDRAQSRDALLPSVNFDTSILYTQSNSLGAVEYIANNAPHEYVSQGNVHQQVDPRFLRRRIDVPRLWRLLPRRSPKLPRAASSSL